MARKRHKRKSKLGKEQTKKEHSACCKLDLSHLFNFKERHHNARRMQEQGKSKKGSKAVTMKRCLSKCSTKIYGVRNKDLSIHDVPKASLQVDEENKARSAPDKSYGSSLTKILGADEMSNECYEASPPTTISSSIPATQFYSFCDEEAGVTAGPELVIDNASSTFSIHLDHEMEMFAGRRSVSSLEYRHWNSHSERSYATNSSSYSRHTELGELGKQLLAKHAVLQKKLDEAKKAILNNNYSGAKELARDLIFHQSKDFLEALEMYNVNREQVLISPQTQTAKHVPERQSFREDEAAHYSSPSPSGTDMSPSDGKDSEHTIHGDTLLTAHGDKTQETDSPVESERTNETKDGCNMERGVHPPSNAYKFSFNNELFTKLSQNQSADLEKSMIERQPSEKHEAAAYSSSSLGSVDTSPGHGKDWKHTINRSALLTEHGGDIHDVDSPIELEHINETKDECNTAKRVYPPTSTTIPKTSEEDEEAAYSSSSLGSVDTSPGHGKDWKHTINRSTLLTEQGGEIHDVDSPIELEHINETKNECNTAKRVYPPSTTIPKTSKEDEEAAYSSSSLGSVDTSPGHGKDWKHTVNRGTLLTEHGGEIHDMDSPIESEHTNETKDECSTAKRVYPPTSTTIPKPSEQDEAAAYSSSSLHSVDTSPGHGKDWKHTVNRSTLFTEHGGEIHYVDSPIESEHTKETKDECNTARRVYPPMSTNELRCKKKSGNGATTHLREIKCLLKYALKKGKRERKNISMDGILQKVPYGSNHIRGDALDKTRGNAICRWTEEHEKTSYNSCISPSSSGQELCKSTDIMLSTPELDLRYNNPTLNTNRNADEEPALESFGEDQYLPKLSSQETVSEGNCITESYKKEPHVQIFDSRASRYQKPNKGNDVSSELNSTVIPLQESEVLHATNAKRGNNKAKHKHSCWKCHKSHGSLEMDSIVNPIRESEKVKRELSCWKCHRSHGNLDLNSTVNPLQKSEILLVTSTKDQRNEVKPKTSCWKYHRAHDSLDMDNTTNPHQESEVLHAIGTKIQKNKVKTKLSCLKCHKSHGSLKIDSIVYPVQDS